MKLESLSLANCGGFGQIDIGIEPDVTLIAGLNGVGKSTELHALAVLLSRVMPEFHAVAFGAAALHRRRHPWQQSLA